MSALLTLLALLLAGEPMRSEEAFRERKAERELRAVYDRPDRFVDFGVVLRVVEADPDGVELIEGKPRMRLLRTHHLGGVVDTEKRAIVGPSRSPQIWHCSADQEPIILHGDSLPLGLLVYGSEGAGKSTCAAMWHYARAVEHLGEGREGGQVAPTRPRLKFVRDAMTALYPRAWYSYRAAEDVFTFIDGTRIQLRAAKRQSGEGGSPVQGFNWSWCCGDEMQDMVEAHSDIEARGRSARAGRYKQLRTATAKDSSSWRTLRDMLTRIGAWHRSTLLGTRSPFIAPEFWQAKRTSLTEREFRRRVLAEDVGPERMLYHTWDREQNLRTLPSNAQDVTMQVLRPWADNATLLVGHDPGKLWHVSLFLKAYAIPGEPGVSWFVVGEESTRQATIEQHVANVVARCQRDWRVNLLNRHGRQVDAGPVMMVRADPYSESSVSDASPDRGVYTTWRRAGVLIHPAAYVASASRLAVGRIPKEGGIDMVCRLFCSADGKRRLFVERKEDGAPVAPRLVESIESMERDEAGRAEMERKDVYDRSHWPAALRYGLWAIERPRLERVA